MEELGPQLARQKGDVLDDRQPHTPVLVLGQVLDCWQETLSQQFDPNHLDEGEEGRGRVSERGGNMVLVILCMAFPVIG